PGSHAGTDSQATGRQGSRSPLVLPHRAVSRHCIVAVAAASSRVSRRRMGFPGLLGRITPDIRVLAAHDPASVAESRSRRSVRRPVAGLKELTYHPALSLLARDEPIGTAAGFERL